MTFAELLRRRLNESADIKRATARDGARRHLREECAQGM
jgi:hypothetical protein